MSQLFTIILIQQKDAIGGKHIGESLLWPALGMEQKRCSARTGRRIGRRPLSPLI